MPSENELAPTYTNDNPGTYTLSFTGTRVPDVLYSEDMEGAIGSEWSSTLTDTAPSDGRRFLGQFSDETVSLDLTGLPAHDSLTLCFSLYVMKSWDGHVGSDGDIGPDLFDVTVSGGPTLLHATAHTPPLGSTQSPMPSRRAVAGA